MLAGSTVGRIIAAASERSLVLALVVAIPVAVGVLIGLLQYQHIVWRRALALPLSADDT